MNYFKNKRVSYDAEKPYVYDKNGNLIEIGPMRLSYDGLDRLIMLERPGFSHTEYAYDESHRRISKKNFLWQEGSWQEEETERFIFFNKREVGCLSLDGSTREFRVLGLGRGAELGASVSIEVEGKMFCPLHDHRGNITLLIDTLTKQPTDTYRYSAFGEEELFGETKNPWRFSSKRTDPESGFVFFGRRYYSPEVGRFLTPDPLGFADGPNLYSYVHNSPLILVDPYGLFGVDDVCSAVSSIGSAIGDWFSGSSGSSGSFAPTSDGSAGGASSVESLLSEVANLLKDFFGKFSGNGLSGTGTPGEINCGSRGNPLKTPHQSHASPPTHEPPKTPPKPSTKDTPQTKPLTETPSAPSPEQKQKPAQQSTSKTELDGVKPIETKSGIWGLDKKSSVA